jgi:hypothetical protein
MKNSLINTEANNKLKDYCKKTHKLCLLDDNLKEKDYTQDNSSIINRDGEYSSVKRSKKNWEKVHNIFRGINVFKNIEVKELNHNDELNVIFRLFYVLFKLANYR